MEDGLRSRMRQRILLVDDDSMVERVTVCRKEREKD